MLSLLNPKNAQARYQFIARSHKAGISRIYFGWNGPKYLLPTPDTEAVETWWVGLIESAIANGKRSRIWLIALVALPALYIIIELPNYESGIIALIIMTLVWFFHNGRKWICTEFEQRFPNAKPQSGGLKRFNRIVSIALPHWSHLLLVFIGIGITPVIFAFGLLHNPVNDPPVIVLDLSSWITYTLTFLLGVWGIVGLGNHIAFRRKFKRRPVMGDFRDNIDWFDSIDA